MGRSQRVQNPGEGGGGDNTASTPETYVSRPERHQRKHTEEKASGGVEQDQTTVSGVVLSFSWRTSCFSPYTSNLKRVRFDSHDLGGISPQRTDESLCQPDDTSIDRLVHWRLLGLAGECGEDLDVAWPRGVMDVRYGVSTSVRFSRLLQGHPSSV